MLDGFSCVICSYKTRMCSSSRELHKVHLSRGRQFECSGDLEKYECHNCVSFKTQCLAELKQHIAQGHVSENIKLKPYRCPKCDFKSYSKYLVGRHIIFVKHQETRKVSHNEPVKHPETTNILLDKVRQEQNLNGQSQNKTDYQTEKIDINQNLKNPGIKAKNATIQWNRCDFCSHRTRSEERLREHIRKTHDPRVCHLLHSYYLRKHVVCKKRKDIVAVQPN